MGRQGWHTSVLATGLVLCLHGLLEHGLPAGDLGLFLSPRRTFSGSRSHPHSQGAHRLSVQTLMGPLGYNVQDWWGLGLAIDGCRARSLTTSGMGQLALRLHLPRGDCSEASCGSPVLPGLLSAGPVLCPYTCLPTQATLLPDLPAQGLPTSSPAMSRLQFETEDKLAG